MRRPRRNHSPTFADRPGGSEAPPLKELHVKIGQQALEFDYLAGALGRLPGLDFLHSAASARVLNVSRGWRRWCRGRGRT